ncbi:MAG: hypothetical protein NT062_16735 [Proteobacteria bacterium]|nr:hypothetical protein [Pseudomonadota bacterium]
MPSGLDTKVTEASGGYRPGNTPSPTRRTPPELAMSLDLLDPKASLATRLDALEDVARWVIEIPTVKRLLKPAPLQLARLRTLVSALAVNPTYRERFAGVVGSILRDTSAVALFAEAGMPNDRGLGSETMDRIASRILPRPPDDEDLERFVSRVFRTTRDCAWLEVVPLDLLAELGNLIAAGDAWRPIREAMADAVALLCTRISALGLSAHMRERSDPMLVRDSPFFRLPHSPLEQLPMLILESRAQLSSIRKRLETAGVSVDVVYCIDAIRRMLARIEKMLPFLGTRGDAHDRAGAARDLLGALTSGRIQDSSLRQLGKQNLALLAQKVIERVGHTGEHYVTTTRREYWFMMLSAAGGGALTAFTVIFKFLLKWAHFAPFLDGFTAGLNYSICFVAMQLLGLTLATKQPSMTAAALAATLRESKGDPSLDELVTLISRITRSQFAAACGNVLTVIPVVLILDVLIVQVTGDHFLDAATAAKEIASFHPFKTLTILFAAYTGVLLWLSSLGAGYLENWVTFRRLPEAIRHHRLGKVVGWKRMDKFANFLTNYSAGIGGSVTLGMLLGMTPKIFAFFGLGIETRHITLSTGSLAFAGCTLGAGAITAGSCLGIVLIGIMNFGVSFVLALSVALSGRDVSNRQRLRLAGQVGRVFLRRPFNFFYPPKNAGQPGSTPTGASPPPAH